MTLGQLYTLIRPRVDALKYGEAIEISFDEFLGNFKGNTLDEFVHVCLNICFMEDLAALNVVIGASQ